MVGRLDTGCTSGGICRVRELIADHAPEAAYDFRTRFNISIFEIGKTISWLETILLVAVLMRDTSSWLHTAHAKWDYPVSREWIAQAHTFDLLAAINSKKKAKPYPAPWPDPNLSKIGSGTKNSRARELLARMNPKETNGE